VAARHVQEVLDDDLSRLSPRVSIVLPACRAMTTAGDGAAAFFAEALAAPALPQWPFEHARVRLVHGEWLRRARARREARAELAVAMDLFTELDASAWLRRATAEYHATAHVTAHVTATQPGRGRASRPQLTPQERHVARLAASGLTNGDIAARLLLSPKTIATHLSSAFRKLGIRSRVELRDALGPDTEPPASSHDPAPERP
jgi:DNA-binding CsgD family transcriptional regulator